MIYKITIINGSPDGEKNDLGLFLEEVQKKLSGDNIEVTSFILAKEEIHFCVGCWDCWWKTPGLCRYNDSMNKILPEIIHSDLVIFASPMIMGFYSSLIKKTQDRIIPLVHPYIEYVNKESHHLKRYPIYPQIGVILDTKSATEEEVDLVNQIFNRLALNFKTEVSFFYTLNNITVKKLVDEINNI
jgi:multimeric flavodoxin WrbA